MNRNIVGVIIFLIGAITMIFEIAGARLLGPYLGTSVFVWTALIGIVFASLSLGYWLGGKLSVVRSDYILLYLMVGLSALFVLLTTIGNTYVLDRVVKYVPGLRLRATVASLILFAPASLFFGMVLPYGVKLMITRIKTSGRLVGSLYALSTLGSIIGTFAAGFVLLPAIGHLNILFALVLLLLTAAAIIVLMHRRILLSSIPVLLCLPVLLTWDRKVNTERDYIDVDTQYNRVIIYQTVDAKTGKPIRMLRINDESSSAMFTDQDNDLVFDVLKYYRLVDHFVPDFTRSLMIGGSGYAFPKDYLMRHPQASIDVVEIDPGLTKLARKYFNLPDDPRLNIIHDDGRIFLNRTSNKYDAIFMDAYKSLITIPFQLTTREAVQKIYNALSDEGAVFANIISTLNPETNQFLQAQTLTYKSVFPQVLLFAVQYPDPTAEERGFFQNIMLVGLKSDKPFSLSNENPELGQFLSHYIQLESMEQGFILTDEYAPVEYFASRALR